MTSNRPYLLRAIYEWLSDNEHIPQILVDTSSGNEIVPQKYINNNQIILNIDANAVINLQLGNELISFQARFGGKPFQVQIPVTSVVAIFAKENGQGMVFSEEEKNEVEEEQSEPLQQRTETKSPSFLSIQGSKKSQKNKEKSSANLKIIK